MEIVGRITSDASVATLEDGRQVVHFTLAVNDRYKPKNSVPVKTTAFYHCSYWINPKRVEILKKGALVQVSGRLSVSAYIGTDGMAKASLNCHVNSFTIHGWPKEVEYIGRAIPGKQDDQGKEDTPF